MAQSALIVRVPEVDPVIGDLREQFDPAAHDGVPPHVTVLYPFIAPKRITDRVLREIRLALSSCRSFSFRLSTTGRFPDNLHLLPEPSSPFVELTECLVRQFPDCLPYGGVHEKVIPHLTVAQGNPWHIAPAEARLAAAMDAHGSIAARCTAVELIENSSMQWRRRGVFRLGPVPGDRALP